MAIKKKAKLTAKTQNLTADFFRNFCRYDLKCREDPETRHVTNVSFIAKLACLKLTKFVQTNKRFAVRAMLRAIRAVFIDKSIIKMYNKMRK